MTTAPLSPGRDRDAPGLVEAIHRVPRRGVFAITGGGGGMLAELLCAPGASATVLQAEVPYAAQALAEYLGGAPSQACSRRTAGALAMRAFLRARQLGGDFGFAISAALTTRRPRQGDDRAHLAFQDANRSQAWTVDFAGRQPRRPQEDALAGTGLRALAFALGVGAAPTTSSSASAAGGDFAAVMLGARPSAGGGPFRAVLPGAFDPLHEGHRAMRADAARRLGLNADAVGYELSVANVDKPPLDYLELRRRLAQFAPEEIVVTNAPTFLAKARALGVCVFVVGVDTLRRIGAARYHGGAEASARALAELGELGCSFLVYGRAGPDGRFATLADLALPSPLAALCVGVGEAEFRVDASSTALRAQGAGRLGRAWG